MRNAEPVSIRRGDYRAFDFVVERVALLFELTPTLARVSSTLSLRRHVSAASADAAALRLNGEHIKLIEVRIDGAVIDAARYQLDETQLTIANFPNSASIEIITEFDPSANLALEGLYLTNGTFCTQCEAEGFRRITYFPDRPDVLSEFTVTVRADQSAFPVLLSNGNLVSSRMLDGGRHEAVWHDPHKKPAYLFALVAGNIDKLTDQFVTQSGRNVLLEIYSTTANLPRCHWAMQCLIASMKWDEIAYGREYDLDRFMIYAADDFNMGAMENKGLNIFNSRYLLADKDTATDSDFQLVDAIVAHEYFHNWSGNRVTCRDWFQLSLKEGFTVFREQQYSAFRGSPAVVRIEETAFMQSRQFAQDAGPMAHPIRPDEYEAIDNFYTVTVYEKGAEVIRMMHTLLGEAAYRKGSDLYFSRHDGTAATCDDFVAAMESASGVDLSQFKRWYSQAGTPRIAATGEYNAAAKRYTLTLKQQVPATPNQAEKLPMVIPVSVALVDATGEQHNRLLVLNDAAQQFTFEGVQQAPVPSLLRAFSAPVLLEFDYSDDALAMLVTKDSDGVVRWQAMRTLFLRVFDDAAAVSTRDVFHATAGQLLADRQTDPALIAHLLTFPTHNELADRQLHINATQLAERRHSVIAALATHDHNAILTRYAIERSALTSKPYSADAQSVAHRALSATLLALANFGSSPAAQNTALAQWRGADNLTDMISAMTALRDQPCAARETMYRSFHDQWQNDLSMLNRWFLLESSAQRGDAASFAQSLLAHPKFDPKNPNRVRAVVHAFSDLNWSGLHASDGSGYEFVALQIIHFDQQNPSLASRFCDAFSRWHKFEPTARAQQRAALVRILESTALSANVSEIISKTLKAGEL
ncbi:MAG: aminopeptidase N [Betaproteobacteria bacterium]|nr:MAG: aminopeptidase N [Betaproteobacteria bacterium]